MKVKAKFLSVDFETGELTVLIPIGLLDARWRAGEIEVDLSDVRIPVNAAAQREIADADGCASQGGEA
jgi:hypothetical protein